MNGRRWIFFLLILFLTLMSAVYFLMQYQGISFFPPSPAEAQSKRTVMIGVGWRTYRNKIFGFRFEYPAELTIGENIKPNTSQLLYLWLPTGQNYGFHP